jgi:hypothetical protein
MLGDLASTSWRIMYPNVCTTTLMTKRSFATGLGAIGLLGWRRERKARAVVSH